MDVYILDVILLEQNVSSHLGSRDYGATTLFLNIRVKHHMQDLEDGYPEFARHCGIFRGTDDNISFLTLWKGGMMHIWVVGLMLKDFDSGSLRDVAVHDCRAPCLFSQVVGVSTGTVVAALRLNYKIELGDVHATRVRIFGGFLMESEARVV